MGEGEVKASLSASVIYFKEAVADSAGHGSTR